ncbi:HrgA protein [Erythrobacter sp. NFXS35]|uniref:COG2958 family protein n=1 Tax=Erythrobacter sp. NFXS35 TaxID=2818436 RepID=UPI0032DFC146
MKLNTTVVECLKSHQDRRLTAREIAVWIRARYPEETQRKLERSKALQTEADLVQQLVAEIGANRPAIEKRFPQIRTTEDRPRLYFWSEVSEEAEVARTEQFESKMLPNHQPIGVIESPLREMELYPKLAQYLSVEFGIHSQRIDEKRSANKRGPQGNRWLFPDVVALEDLTKEWTVEVRQCVSEAGAQKARMWSLEVKLLLNRSNVREAYFQTVSNSSWANFAYLVSGEIEGTDTLKELRMLAALHGVGVIKLDPDNPAESQILIPARERQEIDWANCNRLASENSDFQKVVNLLWQFHRTGDARPSEWKS